MKNVLYKGARFVKSLPKTLYFNFHYFPFKVALKLPVFVDYKVRFMKLEGNIKLNYAPRRFEVKIGGSDTVLVDKKYNRTIWKSEGTVIFHGPFKLAHSTVISVERSAVLEFGENGLINAGTKIICTKRISIGKAASIAWLCTFIDSDFHDIVDENNITVNPDEEIIIGDYVWIGHDCTVKKGVHIASWTILASNSLAIKDITEEKQTWGGNPARWIRTGYWRPSLMKSDGYNFSYR